MNDPYSVLGVNTNASDDEVKRAYRDLARKYHPDNYQNNPLADLAEEKMKEINEAYEAINKMRSGGGGNSYSNGRSQSGGGYSSYNSGGYQQRSYSFDSPRVRQLINSGNVAAAEQILNGVRDRGAEWYFLTGTLAYRKGWMDEARQNFRTACSLEPNNPEYRRSLDYMERGGTAYNPFGNTGTIVNGDVCDCCTTMFCLNCLCGGCG